MRRSWLVVALLLSLGVNIGVFTMIGISRLGRAPGAWAERSAAPGEPPPFERLAERLGIEGERREAFVERQREFFTAFHQQRTELQRVREELRREVYMEGPDRERIEALLQESAAITARLDRLFIDNVLDTRELLDRREARLYFGFLDRLRRDGERRPGPRRGPG